jgi:hypothetical protein
MAMSSRLEVNQLNEVQKSGEISRFFKLDQAGSNGYEQRSGLSLARLYAAANGATIASFKDVIEARRQY